MKENKLVIVIDRPIQSVFNYTLNPENTAKWISGIDMEETNEWPAQLGTLYRNKSSDGVWIQYKIIELIAPDTFTLVSNEDANFFVKYSFKKLSVNSTEFEYNEWVNEGNLEDPFDYSGLESLKTILEG